MSDETLHSGPVGFGFVANDNSNPVTSIQLLASGALLMRDAAHHGELDQVIALTDLMLGVARPWTEGGSNE